jgi:hypothetical protein
MRRRSFERGFLVRKLENFACEPGIAARAYDVIELREAWVHSRCPSGPTHRGYRIRENGPLRQY